MVYIASSRPVRTIYRKFVSKQTKQRKRETKKKKKEMPCKVFIHLVSVASPSLSSYHLTKESMFVQVSPVTESIRDSGKEILKETISLGREKI